MDPDKKASIIELVDYAIEKVTKYLDITPQAETFNKLRSGKVRKEKKRSRHVGQARVLSHKYINKGLKKLAEEEAKKLERQRVLEEKKKRTKRYPLVQQTQNTLRRPKRLGIQNIFEGMKVVFSTPVKTYGDNDNANGLAAGRTINNRTRHIAIRERYVTENANEGFIQVIWVSTSIQAADMFTKPAAEERKTAKETLDRRWRADIQRYHDVVMPAWQAEYAEINAAWAAAKQAAGRKRGSGKKSPYPPRPKRPLKPKVHWREPGGVLQASSY